MTRLLVLLPIVLVASGPALGAPGQEPRRDAPRQVSKANYWLSRDMQRLVFWQSREPGPQDGTPAAR